MAFAGIALAAETAGPPAALRQPTATAKQPVAAPLIPATFSADLATTAGMNAFSAQWRNMDAKIIEVPAMPGAPAPWTTSYNLKPLANTANFDDSSWPVIEPKGVMDHRGGGYMYMTWFRTALTMPAKIGDFDTAGAKVALVVTVDDYAEIWVDGEMLRAPGRLSPGAIQGFNIPNRVMLTESAKPGEKFQLAILAINGPLSASPANAVFMREARVEFFK
jgi:hypothetical protein